MALYSAFERVRGEAMEGLPMIGSRRPGLAALLVLLATAGGMRPAAADAVADFYAGKEITIQVGFGAGGGYDTTTRLFANYFRKHIPGNPSIIVKNEPGAGSMKAANTVFAVAPEGRHRARCVRLLDRARAAVRQQGRHLRPAPVRMDRQPAPRHRELRGLEWRRPGHQDPAGPAQGQAHGDVRIDLTDRDHQPASAVPQACARREPADHLRLQGHQGRLARHDARRGGRQLRHVRSPRCAAPSASTSTPAS